MKAIKKLFPCILALVQAGSLSAATEFEDVVPLELVQAFLSNPGFGDSTIYRDLLDDFPVRDFPEGFEVMGSLDSTLSQRVLLRSTLELDTATASLGQYLEIEGWQYLEAFNPGPAQQGGFVSTASQPAFPRIYCHDTHGNLQLFVTEVEVGSHASLSLTQSPLGNFNQPTCSEQIEMRQAGFRGRPGISGVAEYMPRLELPPALNNPIPFAISRFGGTGGGSNNDYESRSSLNSDFDLAGLLAHFTPQLTAQGWLLDGESAHTFMATGSWRRVLEDGRELHGILSVVQLGENSYDLRFRIIAANRAGTAPDPG